MQFNALFDDYEPEEAAPEITPRELISLAASDIPDAHPVRRFAAIHEELCQGPLLPSESELLGDADSKVLLGYAKMLEPVELDGYVDFKVLWAGEKIAQREKRNYQDQWMSETIDPEFYDAHYHEVVAVSILRRPQFSRGETPCLERSFVKVLRGVFPIFAENQARLRLIEIAAEPYAEIG